MLQAATAGRTRVRAVVTLAFVTLALVSGCTGGNANGSGRSGSKQPAPDSVAAPVIAAAGDIACKPGDPATPTACQQKATSDLLLQRPLTAVLALGDQQYDEGRLKNYQLSYGPTWGRVLSITYPTPGNHEFQSGADGYFQYFGKAAGDPKRSYYSLDIGSWHIISLNSECSSVDAGCEKGSPQEQWLQADLRAHQNRCTLAFWHEPRFSSGLHGNNMAYKQFWVDLDAAGADVVLNGHDHDYERFAPQTAAAKADPQGIREFVVGTGGKNLRAFRQPRRNSEVRSTTFGVLELKLEPTSYSWRFLPIAGSSFSDSGSSDCH